MTRYKSKRRHYRISDVDVLIIDAKELFLDFFFFFFSFIAFRNCDFSHPAVRQRVRGRARGLRSGLHRSAQ